MLPERAQKCAAGSAPTVWSQGAGSAPRPFCVRAMPEEQWLRTPQAAIACGVSERTLKRLRGDVLEEGIHYQVGFSSNSAITWEVNGVRSKLAWRGMIQRKAAEVIREQVGA